MTGYYDFFVLCGIVNIQSMLNWGPRQVVHIVLCVQCYQSTSENAGDSLKSVCLLLCLYISGRASRPANVFLGGMFPFSCHHPTSGWKVVSLLGRQFSSRKWQYSLINGLMQHRALWCSCMQSCELWGLCFF